MTVVEAIPAAIPHHDHQSWPLLHNAYTEQKIATTAARILQNVTGDRCFVVRFSQYYWVIRIDPTGKEADQG